MSPNPQISKEALQPADPSMDSLRTQGWNPSLKGFTARVDEIDSIASGLPSPNGFSVVDGLSSETSDASLEAPVMPIAIVGMSCRFPGDSTNPTKLWEMLWNKRSAWSHVPAERFTQDSFYHPSPNMRGTFNARGGHFLKEDISLFDAPFFKISPTEAKAIDPQIRLQLELSYEALENGGITMENVAGTDTAVFIGMFANDYDGMMASDRDDMLAHHAVGTGNAMFSNRISYFFDLKGPSVTLDTGCSASLVALHQACQSIRNGESKQAIVGGTNLMLDTKTMISLSSIGFLSDDGRSYSFDSRAAGYGRGEGVASIVIKPLKDAIAAGNPIRAVIRNTGVNQDGRTPGITMPSGEAQERLIRSTYAKARLDPHDTDYVEAHGTGTSAGDPVETSAIGAVLARPNEPSRPLYMGSVKTNIGHLESTSGLAGLLKAVLSLERGAIIPSINFQKANEALLLKERNIVIPQDPQPWPTSNIRRASVNSFGYGGTNAHVILEAFQADSDHGTACNDIPRLPSQLDHDDHCDPGLVDYKNRIFVLSHKTKAGVRSMMDSLRLYLDERGKSILPARLSDLAYTLSTHRSVLNWRIAFTGVTLEGILSTLAHKDIDPRRAVYNPRVGFLFTGQGAQWYAMGRELIGGYPAFRKSLSAAETHLKVLGTSWSLMEELLRPKDLSHVNSAAICQPLCTAIQIALVDLLASWNVTPTAVMGHSSGEIAAAYACGAINRESAITIAYHRGRLASTLERGSGVRGAMLAVGLSEEDVESFIFRIPKAKGRVVVACVNSPRSVTVSGDRAAIIRLQSMLEARQIFVRRLAINTAYHSHHMEVLAAEYLAALEGLPKPATDSCISFISSVTGGKLNKEDLDSAYWVENLVSKVRFSEALQEVYLSSKSTDDRAEASWTKPAVDLLVEIGPHSALAGFVKQYFAASTLKEAKIKCLASLVREKDAVQTTLNLAAELFVAGCPVDLEAINSADSDGRPRVLTDLPPYPWDHSVSYWHESRFSSDYRLRKVARHPLLGTPSLDNNLLEPRWRNIVRVAEIPWLRGHVIQSQIVYPAAGYIAMALEASLQRSQARAPERRISGFRLRNVDIGKALLIPDADDGVETCLSLRPYSDSARTTSDIWDEFQIYSYSKTSGWSEHCRGLISVQYDQGSSEVEGDRELEHEIARYKADIETSRSRSQVPIDPAQMYKKLRSFGLEYTDAFASVDSIVTAPHQSLGTVTIPNTSTSMPKGFQPAHIVHPATLDSCLQVIFPALLSADCLTEPMVPTHIEEIFISSAIRSDPGERLLVHALTSLAGNRACRVNMNASRLSTEDLELPVIQISGLTCTTIPGGAGLDQQVTKERKICHKMQWAPQRDVLSVEHPEQLHNSPSSRDLPEVTIIGPAESGSHSQSLISSLSTRLGPRLLSTSQGIDNLNDSSTDGKVCICLVELDSSVLRSCAEPHWSSIQKMLSSTSSVLWITRGAVMNATSPDAGLVAGLFRSARSENEALRIVTLDLDPCQSSPEDSAEVIVDVLAASFGSGGEGRKRENEYAQKDGQLFVPRLLEDKNLQHYLTASTTVQDLEVQDFFQADRPLRLEVGTPGLLDSIRFVEDERAKLPLGLDEVRIDLRASGVNFRDIMISLGQLDDASEMYGEHSGIISAVGQNMGHRFKVGDRVCACGGNAYASSVVVNGLAAQKIPDDMSFETAASIPIVYATAYYSLIHLARLQKDETVLIHSAAGGVGQAAVMLAQHLGAKVFVTVGSNEKKALVMKSFGIPEERIFSSRHTTFVHGIKRLTSGKGVDVVLNSIAGEGFRETCHCVAALGRFIEIGKRDIVTNRRLDMEMFSRNVMFASVDLTIVFNKDPNFGGTMMEEIFYLLRRGAISPVQPIRIFPISDLESAFRLIQAGKHTGKVVLKAEPDVKVKVVPKVAATAEFAQDASYLIIGGLGGLGRAICRWMANLKAKNIIVLSRSGVRTESSRALMRELEDDGVKLKAYACDVGDFEQLHQVLSLCANQMPPIRGVIQAAMALKDTIIDTMTLKEYQYATRPKVGGTHNLHRLLSNTPLDFFIILSSCSGIIGNHGQANYASACTYQDAFARYRTGLGLPTRSLDLGMIESVGYVSENPSVFRSLVAHGFIPVKLKEFLALLNYAITTPIKDIEESQLIVGLSSFKERDSNFLDAKFTNLCSHNESPAITGGGSETSKLHVAIKNATSIPQVNHLIAAAIIERVSNVLVVPIEDISPARPISSYGGDSLTAVELRNWFVRTLQVNIGVMEILSGKSIEALAADVAGRSQLVCVGKDGIRHE